MDAHGSVVAGSSLRSTLRRQLRVVSAVAAAGALLGLLIGGVGGRVAMRVLFLTSEPWVRGVISDDGFAIGQISGATFVLLCIATFFGVVGAFVYLAVRPFLLGPDSARWTTAGVLAAVGMGAVIIHPDGVDFTLLGPRWLAVVLFVAIPALYGVLIGPAVRRVTRPDGWFATASPWLAYAPLILVFLPGPPLLLVGLPALVVIVVHHRIGQHPAWSRLVGQPALLWTGRVVLLALAAGLGADLVRKAAIILSGSQ